MKTLIEDTTKLERLTSSGQWTKNADAVAGQEVDDIELVYRFFHIWPLSDGAPLDALKENEIKSKPALSPRQPSRTTSALPAVMPFARAWPRSSGAQGLGRIVIILTAFRPSPFSARRSIASCCSDERRSDGIA